jgi:hypothetical protein
LNRQPFSGTRRSVERFDLAFPWVTGAEPNNFFITILTLVEAWSRSHWPPFFVDAIA